MRAFKMNGTGNAFLLIDACETPVPMATEKVRHLARSHQFDQLLLLEPSDVGEARYRIWNRDGAEVGACGNGARCVGWHLMQRTGRSSATLDTAYGLTEARRTADFRIAVDLGPARTGWQDIPLQRESDTRNMDFSLSADGVTVSKPGAASMGNPHIVFDVADIASTPVESLGRIAERDPLFPEGVNTGFMQIMDRKSIRLRVWERGAGLTRACGTGAAAAVVVGHRKDLLDRECRVLVDGGELFITWQSDNHVWLEGPVQFESEVEIDG